MLVRRWCSSFEVSKMSFSLLLLVSFLLVYRVELKILDAFPKVMVTSMGMK